VVAEEMEVAAETEDPVVKAATEGINGLMHYKSETRFQKMESGFLFL